MTYGPCREKIRFFLSASSKDADQPARRRSLANAFVMYEYDNDSICYTQKFNILIHARIHFVWVFCVCLFCVFSVCFFKLVRGEDPPTAKSVPSSAY